MIKQVCDRCGKHIDKDKKGYFSFGKYLHYTSLFGFRSKISMSGEYNLCPECTKDFIKWFDYKSE